MKKRKHEFREPTIEQLKNELNRERYKRRYFLVIRSTVYSLITVAAVAVLVATLWLPVLQIYGHSMAPTLIEGEIVVTVKNSDFKPGDVVAFYYNNKILVKRVIGTPGDWIEIDEEGRVRVNQILLEEPYVQEYALGECDIEMPYQVPEQKVFVMGDHRSTSIESRSSVVGCVSEEAIIGKVIFRLWPFKEIGKI